jgi:GNAT superfamily N-acetyltransferase
VHVRGWQHAYAGHMPQDFLDGLDVTERAGRWRESLASGDGGTLVALDDDAVVGFVAVAADPPEGTLAAIYLEPSRIGTGTGRLLHDAALERLRSLGATRASLDVLAGNAPARRFYERAGWAAVGEPFDDELRGFTVAHQRYERDLSLDKHPLYRRPELR